MKLEDLMIGDWVCCSHEDCEGHQVDLIDTGNNEVGIDGEFSYPERLRPIPLTEEILEKNGFVKDSGGEDLWICDDISVDFDGEDFEFSILSEYREFKGCIQHVQCREFNGCIQYVHELQHAFKLCGIEKEIIL